MLGSLVAIRPYESIEVPHIVLLAIMQSAWRQDGALVIIHKQREIEIDPACLLSHWIRAECEVRSHCNICARKSKYALDVLRNYLPFYQSCVYFSIVSRYGPSKFVDNKDAARVGKSK